MLTKHWFSPPTIAVMLLVAMVIAWRGMYAVGRRSARAHGPAQLIMIQDSIGTLLALMIAFEFSMANSRYDMRENFGVRQANAILSCYRRCDLLSPTVQGECRGLMREYAEITLHGYDVVQLQDNPPIVQRAETILLQLWNTAVRDPGDGTPPTRAFILTGVNDLASVTIERITTNKQFLPRAVIGATLLLCIAWAGVCGYAFGLRELRQGWAWLAFASLVVLLVYLTLDIDRPFGLIRHVRGHATMSLLVDLMHREQSAPH